MTAIDPVDTALMGFADDLAWLDAAIMLAVETQRAQEPGALPGIYVSEEEVDALIARPTFFTTRQPLPEEWRSPRLKALARRCRLDTFDQATLLVAAALGLDHRYGRLCAYLQDDLTKPYVTPGLALDLFGGDFESRSRLRSRFAARAPLRALELIRLGGDETQSLASRPMLVDEPVISYLLAQDAETRPQQPERRKLILPSAEMELLHRIGDEWAAIQPKTRAVVFVAGEPGSGRRLIAQHLANAAGLELVIAGTAPAARDVRSAALVDAVLCLPAADSLFQPETTSARTELVAALIHTEVPLIVTLSRADQAPIRFAGRETRLLSLTPPATEQSAAIWLQEAALSGICLDDGQARLLAGTYRLNGGAIAAAVESASLRDGSASPPLDRLVAAAKAASSTNLGRLGQEVLPRFSWDDIVLPDEVADVLRELILRVRHRSHVFGEWGFTARHARSRSLSALFAGPSGTGKTMAAEVIANELALPLYRVDLAAVVSKYIGETEKNLAQIFNEAASSSAVLFFDEADALFGKRSEVRDSHDRYANIEVSYLLQRMEDYDGIVVLASNFRQNLDEAFVRRLHLTADFPFPNETARLEIWRRTLPTALPLAADVDLPALARRFRLSGGHIRNVCVTAAFLAADDGPVVGMSHFLRAIRREHQKMGKLLLSEERAG